MVKVSTRCPAIREDGLTDKEHVETATDIFLSGLRAGRLESACMPRDQ
jgi:hypothetical protein